MSPTKPRLISNLEAAVLAVLALEHPQRVDAIDAFCALWQIKKIPTPSLSEAMTLLVMAMTALEEMNYARCDTEGDAVWYSLTANGAELITGDGDIKEALGLYALMGADLLAGGKPC
jgi:hypothetical protein